MPAGYTTLFRELGTPEGTFHARFTTNWTASRRGMNALLDACPDDAHLRSFAADFHARRLSLWNVWKNSLPTELRAIVSSLHDDHCAPTLKGGPTAQFPVFVEAYRAWDHFTRNGLRNLLGTHGGNPELVVFTDRIIRSLDALEDAYADLQSAGRG